MFFNCVSRSPSAMPLTNKKKIRAGVCVCVPVVGHTRALAEEKKAQKESKKKPDDTEEQSTRILKYVGASLLSCAGCDR